MEFQVIKDLEEYKKEMYSYNMGEIVSLDCYAGWKVGDNHPKCTVDNEVEEILVHHESETFWLILKTAQGYFELTNVDPKISIAEQEEFFHQLNLISMRVKNLNSIVQNPTYHIVKRKVDDWVAMKDETLKDLEELCTNLENYLKEAINNG